MYNKQQQYEQNLLNTDYQTLGYNFLYHFDYLFVTNKYWVNTNVLRVIKFWEIRIWDHINAY